MQTEPKTETSVRGSKKSILKFLGPALITSALVLGPGSLTLSSKMGALFGNQLLWILIVTVIFMMIYTEMSTRIGTPTNTIKISIPRSCHCSNRKAGHQDDHIPSLQLLKLL